MLIPTITHDGSLDIAIGKFRYTKTWKNQSWLWSKFINRVSTTEQTAETHAEYMAAPRPRQDEIKDVGAFVGGLLAGGKRGKNTVLNRQLITLDADHMNADASLWEDFKLYYNNAACIYSTHKHSPEAPRLRLIIPLDRQVLPDEYVAISRRITESLGIEQFDITTYQAERLMYWPSTSKDGEFIFAWQDGPWLSADTILSSYHDWRDISAWPMGDREKAIPRRDIKKQKDPLTKKGMVGIFCRTYTISEAIEKYLPDIYDPCDGSGDRYSFKIGSTTGGLLIYEDKFAYSHHSTDPISGNLCNAFDLVRLHKFGLLDDGTEIKDPTKLPSFKEMVELASLDLKVKIQLGSEKLAEADDDFAEGPITDEASSDWTGKLDVDGHGKYRSTVNNVLIILRNDPKLKGKFALDTFEHREIITGDLPWRKYTPQTRYITDKDDAGIRYRLEKKYGITGVQKIDDGLAMLMCENSFHPIKDYLEGLEWDGEERVETLFIDYLGAEDNPYIRAVAKKWTAAAIKRIYRPGCKFDYIPVLLGEQGKKKSMLPDKLGQQWYSDSFTTVQGKESFEQLQGAWLIEIPEMSGFRKAEAEAIKHYISKREDRYRVAYGRRVENFPRQSVFIGTGNIDDFIKDATGGRRFWPIDTYIQNPIYDIATDLTPEVIGQIWAEAYQIYDKGESLYLSEELEQLAKEVQKQHSEQGGWNGAIEQYLETLIPADWYSRNLSKKWDWLNGLEDLAPSGEIERTKVCIAEIWCEALRGRIKDMTRLHVKELHDAMRRMPGWKYHKGKMRFGEYGVQCGYVKNVKTDMQKRVAVNSATATRKSKLN